MDKKPKLPPVFTGNAIRVTFIVDQIEQGPDGQPMPTKASMEVITFPHWVHTVFIDGKDLQVYGRDLLESMMIKIDNSYIAISSIDKEVLYRGIETQTVPIGHPQVENEIIKNWDFKRVLFDDGRNVFEATERPEDVC